MVDLYQRIFKLSWHLLRAPWLWGKNGGLGSGKGRQDPQGLQHLLQKRDKNTSDCAILGSMVWKRPHFLKASLLKNCSQGGQTPMAPPCPKVTAEPPQIGSILFLTRYSVVFQGQQKKTASHATKAGVEEKILPLINT